MVKYRHNSCQNLFLVGIDVARKFIVPLRAAKVIGRLWLMVIHWIVYL